MRSVRQGLTDAFDSELEEEEWGEMRSVRQGLTDALDHMGLERGAPGRAVCCGY